MMYYKGPVLGDTITVGTVQEDNQRLTLKFKKKTL
jgi:hypothetical protein